MGMNVITRRHFFHSTLRGLVFFSYSLLAGIMPNSIKASEPKPKPYRSTFIRKGLHTQPWFLNSFLDLEDDLEEAKAQGKRFAIIWELAGCPYCRETHLVNFAIPELNKFIKKNFEILQLDLRGSREVVDFDGKKMTERDLARRNNIRFTPTVQFFTDNLNGVTEEKELGVMEVSRMPGYFRPQHFLGMFQYILDKGYEVGDYRSYLKNR